MLERLERFNQWTTGHLYQLFVGACVVGTLVGLALAVYWSG